MTLFHLFSNCSHEDKRMTAGGSVTSKPTAASAAAAATKSSKSSSQNSPGIRERLWRQLATIGSSSSNSAAPQPKKSRSLSRMASALSREFLWRKRGNGERNVYMCNAATNTIQTRDAAFSKRADVSRRGECHTLTSFTMICPRCPNQNYRCINQQHFMVKSRWRASSH